MTDYGGNYDEWSLACPDGAVWPDTFSSAEGAQDALRTADQDCGCEESPHVVVSREVPEWESA